MKKGAKTPGPSNDTSPISRGVDYARIGEHEKAIAEFTAVIDDDPQNVSAYYNRAQTYLTTSEYDKALADFNTLLELRPESAIAHLYRGVVYKEKSDNDRAFEDFNVVIRLDTKCAPAYFERGSIYIQRGNYEQAIEDITTAISFNFTLPAAAYFYRGNAHYAKGEYDLAIADFTEAIPLDTSTVQAYFHRGHAHWARGDSSEAVADFTKIIESDPGRAAEARSHRALIAYETGDYDGSIADFSTAIQNDPEDITSYLYRGLSYHERGDYESAIGDFARVSESNRTGPILFLRAMSHFALRDYGRAAADLTEAIALDTTVQPTVYFYRGLSHHYSHGDAKAIDDLTKAIEIESEWATAFLYRGIAHARNGDQGAAIADLSRAMELDASIHGEANYYRGIAHLERGDFDHCIADMTEAIDRDVNLAQAFDIRGHAYRATGRIEQAQADFTNSVEIAADCAPPYCDRGITALIEGNYDSAIVALSKAIQLDAMIPAEFYFERGRAYFGKGEYDSALADFNYFIERDQSEAAAYHARGSTRFFLNNYDLAIADLTKAIELGTPDMIGAYLLRGRAYNKTGNYDGAVTDLSRVIADTPGPTPYYFRGFACGMNNQIENAITDFTKVIELAPRWTSAYIKRGLLHKFQGNFGLAAADFERVMQLEPGIASETDIRRTVEEINLLKNFKISGQSPGELIRLLSDRAGDDLKGAVSVMNLALQSTSAINKLAKAGVSTAKEVACHSHFWPVLHTGSMPDLKREREYLQGLGIGTKHLAPIDMDGVERRKSDNKDIACALVEFISLLRAASITFLDSGALGEFRFVEPRQLSDDEFKAVESFFSYQQPELLLAPHGHLLGAREKLEWLADVIELPPTARTKKLLPFDQVDGFREYVLKACRLPSFTRAVSEKWFELGKEIILFLTDNKPVEYQVLYNIGKSAKDKSVNRKGEVLKGSSDSNVRVLLFRELKKAFRMIVRDHP